MYFAAEGSVEEMESAWSNDIDINAVDSKGGNALFYAARNGHVAAVKWLLALGADASIKLKSGKTAEDIAEKNGHTDCADLIRMTLRSRSDE